MGVCVLSSKQLCVVIITVVVFFFKKPHLLFYRINYVCVCGCGRTYWRVFERALACVRIRFCRVNCVLTLFKKKKKEKWTRPHINYFVPQTLGLRHTRAPDDRKQRFKFVYEQKTPGRPRFKQNGKNVKNSMSSVTTQSRVMNLKDTRVRREITDIR